MTPGMEALAEAARIESARIYSRTCAEPHDAHRRARDERVRGVALDSAVAYRFNRGQSVAAIALQLGHPREVIEAVLERLAS